MKFEEASAEAQVLWKVYVLEILPAIYGRGASNFWNMYRRLKMESNDASFLALFSATDEAIALAAVECKRWDAVHIATFRARGRGAPKLKDQNPIKETVFRKKHKLVMALRTVAHASWYAKFDEWAEERMGVSRSVASAADDDDQDSGVTAADYGPVDDDEMNRAMQTLHGV